MVVWTALFTGSNFWLSYWSMHSQFGNNYYYCSIYTLMAMAYGTLCYVRASMVFFQAIECSRQIHTNMFSRIIRAPVNLFFDRVPIGRLLNRFSKDLGAVDGQLVMAFNIFLLCGFVFLADIVICCISGT